MIVAVTLSIYFITDSLGWTFSEFLISEELKAYSTVFNTDSILDKGYFLKSFFGGIFITICMTGLDQDMMQKNLSCKSLKDAQKNMLSFSIVLTLVTLLFLLLGALLFIYAKKTGFPFQESFHLASTIQLSNTKYSINDGKPDLRLHPVHQFSRWYSSSMKRKTLINKWNKSDPFFNSLFQTQLCNYLNATRGFHISPNNIVNTRSTEMSLYVVSQLLLKQNDIVLVGNLSNYASNMIFQQTGARIKTIPVDKNGLNIEYIKKHFVKHSIRCVYICAHRDYPTTVKLSTERRLALLQLAKEYKFAIIEDDYDYDFQFEGSAMLPMATADTNGMVIYLGKLGQSLFPSFQTGFVIAPENLISEAKNYLQLLDKQGDLIQEQMLSELITEGEIYRLMKKNIVNYKQRRDYFCKLLTTYFKEVAQWNIPTGGLAIWLQFEPKISLIKLAKEANKNDLFIPNTVLYQDKNTCAIRVGFGHLDTDEIEPVIKRLKNAYNKIS